MADSEQKPQPGSWEPSEEDADLWRGGEHLEWWPEELAGPEYWAYRHREAVEQAVIDLVGKETARPRRRRDNGRL